MQDEYHFTSHPTLYTNTARAIMSVASAPRIISAPVVVETRQINWVWKITSASALIVFVFASRATYEATQTFFKADEHRAAVARSSNSSLASQPHQAAAGSERARGSTRASRRKRAVRPTVVLALAFTACPPPALPPHTMQVATPPPSPAPRVRGEWERLESWLVEPDLSGNRTALPAHDAACPSATDGYRSSGLRVVSDPTREPDIEIIADRLVNSSVARDAVVTPVMTGRPGQVHTQHCKAFFREENWRRQCPEGSQAEHQWWTCDIRQFVAKVHCGYLDADNTIPCMAYDRTRTFPVHGNHPGPAFQPLRKGGRMITLDKLAHNMAVYPAATAHYFNQASEASAPPRLPAAAPVAPPRLRSPSE